MRYSVEIHAAHESFLEFHGFGYCSNLLLIDETESIPLGGKIQHSLNISMCMWVQYFLCHCALSAW
jgi:hypothetical protein